MPNDYLENPVREKELEILKSELTNLPPQSMVYVRQPNSNIFFKESQVVQLQKVSTELQKITSLKNHK